MTQLFRHYRALALLPTLCCGFLLAGLPGCGQMGPLYQPLPENPSGAAQSSGVENDGI